MEEYMIKLSIIVPVYKVERYINQCIESILMQTYTNFEVILIDDGSPDNCGKICDEYKIKDNRVNVIHKKNQGLMAAWIDGVKIARGDYIVFVDSDDWIEEKMLESMVVILEKYNPDLISCNFTKDFPNKQVNRKNCFSEGFYSKDDITDKIYANLLNNGSFQGRGIPISRWGKLINKDLIIKNLKYCDTSISFSEDLNIMFPVLLDCSSIYIMNDENYFYHYRMNNESILHTYNSIMYKQILLLYKILFRVSEDKGKYDFTNQLLSDYVAACVQCVKNELMNKNKLTIIIDTVYNISNDKLLQSALDIVNYKQYSTINKFIIKVLKSNNKNMVSLSTIFLKLIKQLKSIN
jgi:glycosyltransferase involved in cell wall biosynthesis